MAERTKTVDILVEVGLERKRQDAKFPDQRLPDGTGPKVRWSVARTDDHRPSPPTYWFTSAATAEDLARLFKAQTGERAISGGLTWLDVLLEEFAEALAEEDQDKLRTELIQLAAVAVRWIEDIDRRT